MTGSDQSIVRETDVVRQAELVTMEYLKSWKCAESLDTLMTKTGTKASSSVASELYAADLEKKKAMGKHSSVLEYLVSSSVDQVKSETSSSRRRSSVDSSCSSSSSGDKEVAWSKDELSLLRKAIKQTNSVDDKNDRWKQIAVLVGNGKSKKHCYVKYKELKQEQSGGKSSSSKTRPSTSEPRVRRDSVALMKEGKGSIPLLDAKEEEEFTAKSSSFVKTEVAKELRPVNAPAQKMEELEMEDCDDLESVVPAGRKPVISFQDRPASSSANITRATRAPTSEEVASLRQLLFGEDKKSFSSHWQEQVRSCFVCLLGCSSKSHKCHVHSDQRRVSSFRRPRGCSTDLSSTREGRAEYWLSCRPIRCASCSRAVVATGKTYVIPDVWLIEIQSF